MLYKKLLQVKQGKGLNCSLVCAKNVLAATLWAKCKNEEVGRGCGFFLNICILLFPYKVLLWCQSKKKAKRFNFGNFSGVRILHFMPTLFINSSEKHGSYSSYDSSINSS